jgi:hypothetical protein
MRARHKVHHTTRPHFPLFTSSIGHSGEIREQNTLIVHFLKSFRQSSRFDGLGLPIASDRFRQVNHLSIQTAIQQGLLLIKTEFLTRFLQSSVFLVWLQNVVRVGALCDSLVLLHRIPQIGVVGVDLSKIIIRKPTCVTN